MSKWTTRVIPSSYGLRETSYAHQVICDGREITVRHTSHKNYDHIITRKLDREYVENTGVGYRQPDLTPHPEAVAIAKCLNELDGRS